MEYRNSKPHFGLCCLTLLSARMRGLTVVSRLARIPYLAECLPVTGDTPHLKSMVTNTLINPLRKINPCGFDSSQENGSHIVHLPCGVKHHE